MPNQFMFSRIADPTKSPVRFIDIDAELCAAFDAQPHPTLYYCGWYDWLGERAALGYSYNKMREEFRAQAEGRLTPDQLAKILAIIDWFEAHYVPDAWAMRGKP